MTAFTASVAMLALVGALFTRTIVEMRAAERFRDGQQSFYLAEGGLDAALTQVTSAAGAQNLANGSYTYERRILNVELIPPGPSAPPRRSSPAAPSRATTMKSPRCSLKHARG